MYIPIGDGVYEIDFSACGESFLVDFADTAPWTIAPAPGDPAEPGAPAPLPIVVTAQDMQRLPIEPGGLTVQPDRGWVLVNLDTVVWTDGATQTLDTVVLGAPVQVRVTPVDYTWDFGDGSAPLVTTDPGAPYPDHSVSHVYERAADSATVELTTRWAGEFQVAGSGVWMPVAGLATTTETSAPFDVRTAEASLTDG